MNNTKSLWNSFLTFKQRLTNSINDKTKFLDAISMAIDVDPDTVAAFKAQYIDDTKIMLQDGISLELSKASNTGQTLLKFAKQGSDILTQTVDLTAKAIDENITGYEDIQLSVRDILSQVNNQIDIDSAMASVNETYLSGISSSLSSLTTRITNSVTHKTDDVQSLLSIISEMSTDGKLNSFQWASIANNVFSAQEKQLGTEDPLGLTAVDPFVMNSFFGTILQVASILFTVAITAISVIFKNFLAIFSVVAGVLPNILSSLNVASRIRYDGDTLYPGIKGTLYVGKLMNKTTNQPIPVGFNPDDADMFEGAPLIHLFLGSMDIYMVRDSAKRESVLDNTYTYYIRPVITYHPNKLFNYLKTKVQSVTKNDKLFSGTINASSLATYGLNDPDVDICLSTEDYLNIDQNENWKRSLILWNLVGIYYSLIPSAQTIQNAPMDKSHFETLAASLILATGAYANIDDLMYDMDPVGVGTANDFSRLLYEGLIKMMNAGFNPDANSVHQLWISGTTPRVEFYNNPLALSSNDTVEQTGEYYLYGYRPDGQGWLNVGDIIPSGDMLSLPDFDIGSIIFTTLGLAAIVGVSTIAIKGISRSMKAKKQVKQSKRALEISKAKEAWSKDPDNKELKKAYEQAITTYSTKAEIFGWPAYDSTNNWIEYDTTDADSGSSEYLRNIANLIC